MITAAAFGASEPRPCYVSSPWLCAGFTRRCMALLLSFSRHLARRLGERPSPHASGPHLCMKLVTHAPGASAGGGWCFWPEVKHGQAVGYHFIPTHQARCTRLARPGQCVNRRPTAHRAAPQRLTGIPVGANQVGSSARPAGRRGGVDCAGWAIAPGAGTVVGAARARACDNERASQQARRGLWEKVASAGVSIAPDARGMFGWGGQRDAGHVQPDWVGVCHRKGDMLHCWPPLLHAQSARPCESVSAEGWSQRGQ